MPGIIIGLPFLSMSGMPGIAIDVGWPRAMSQRFMKFISSDCERLVRAPRAATSLFPVCDGMSAVISTACAWCMIMPCMKSMSAWEALGAAPEVDGGRVLVELPGAPGWTITGGGEDCWA